MPFTVGELSRLTGLTVRALRYYDEIGLVPPSARSDAGYRLYDDRDVHRLQQVVMLRELGVPLDDIARALTGDRAALLQQHRVALADKRARIDRMLAAVDAALADLEKGHTMQPNDVSKMFDGFRPEDYEDEVVARWGNTEAYRESARRTKGYGKADWDEIRRELDSIHGRLVALMQQGVPVSDPAVQALVAEHRAHIDRWYYPCSVQMHRGLGEMYVADPRFTANLDKAAPGFAQFLRDAIAHEA